jgi:hypothetical protein
VIGLPDECILPRAFKIGMEDGKVQEVLQDQSFNEG